MTVPQGVEAIETVVAQLERLKRHVGALRKGQTSARDDVANVLHLLGGRGQGYGRLYDAAQTLADAEPVLPVWSTDFLREADGLPVVIGLRSVAYSDDEEVTRLPLSEFLDQPCLRYAVPGVEPQTNWSWRDLIKHVRSKFGSHADQKPPLWLQDLRYYPAADTDVFSFLLWSAGEAVLEASTGWLYGHGVAIDPYSSQRYLNGARLSTGYVLYDDSRLDVRAGVQMKKWDSGRRRAIIGGIFRDQPFIFGVTADKKLFLDQGELGVSLRDFYNEFRTTRSPSPPNRNQRRAAAKKRRRNPTV